MIEITFQKDTSICIAQDHQPMLHMASESVDVPLSQKNLEEKCVLICITQLEYFTRSNVEQKSLKN